MDGLPFLPGNTFQNPTATRFHRSHTLGYTNGYAIQKRPELSIGGMPLRQNQLSEQDLDDLANYNPTLTYGQAKQAPPEEFVPAYVAFDKKVLRFRGWYKENIPESPAEQYRIHHVDVYYYLEDDSMAVFEPRIENSGIPHGKLVRRQRVPKNDVGDVYTWKDINVRMNLACYGRVYRLYDCDHWTREWLESEGIEVNDPEGCPADPYTSTRKQGELPKVTKTPNDMDKLRKFLELDRKVLRFYCIWDDRDQMFGEARKFLLHYYLVNDTVEVREIHTPNDGRDPFPILISRQRVPKNRYDVGPTFPAVVMELSDKEIKEYFTPADFEIGKIVQIYNRRFFIYDCDNFTRAYYWKTFGRTDFDPIPVDNKGNIIPQLEPMVERDDNLREMPQYTGFGLLEDSMQSCQTLIPQPPKKDFIKMLENDGIVLRYEGIMDTPKPEDKGRRFIISFRLSDDMITIYEPPIKNSGLIGGKFLERTRVAKPGSTPEKPQFYGPQDFYIGAVIHVFRHRFLITNADAFVLTYMEQHPTQFPAHVIEALRQKQQTSPSSTLMKNPQISTQRTGSQGELDRLVDEVLGQLKRLAITGSIRKDRMFLGVDIGRLGFVNRENIRDMCINHQLPCDDDIVDSLARRIGQDPDHITFDELRSFFENY
jgi:hypothetical protein